ncbi:hypothetical protein [Tardiphaga robiniae]|uniref:hypothetical protein n=1 Tax=Tardiphaga TaxID=1395974 RepID=UPI00286093CF|nr:hypothetical protein [Tardiphaga robiniae]MDR6657682.1 hypothetical protein [Tardiphaga robiniae]
MSYPPMRNDAEAVRFLVLLLCAEVSNTALQIGSLHIAVGQRFSDLAAFAQLRQIAAHGNRE